MTEKTMKLWCFTFGCDHPLARHAQPVRAESCTDARVKMLATYGTHWCGQYGEEEWKGINDRFGPYTLLPKMSVTREEAAEIAERMEATR